MAYFNHAFQKMLVSNGSVPVAQDVHPKDLTAGQIAFIDARTNLSIIGNLNVTFSPMVYIAQGSYHTTDKVGPYHGGYKESVKTKGINPRYVSAFYLTEPANPVQDIVTICAVAGCDIQCDRTYRLRVDIKGSPALRFLTHNVYYTLDAYTGCCTTTAPLVAPATDPVDPTIVLLQWADQINAYPTTKDFVRASVTSTSGTTTASTAAAAGSVTVNNRTGLKIGDKMVVTLAAAPSATGTIIGDLFTLTSAAANPFTVGMTLSGTSGGGTVVTGTKIVSWVSGNGTAIGSSFRVSPANNVTGFTNATPPVATPVTITGTTAATMFVASTYGTAAQTGAGVVPTAVAATASTPAVPEVIVGATATTAAAIVTSNVLSSATYVPLTVAAQVDAAAPCLELIGAYVDTVFQDCSFSPMDHVEYQPVDIYASVSVIDVLGYQCAAKCFTITETQQAVQGKGFGETLIRELILAKRYLQEPWQDDPRYREILDYNPFAEITRGNKYYVYHILHSVPRKNNPTGVFDNDQYLVKIVSPTRNAAFETAFSGYLTSAANYEAVFKVLP